MEPLLQRRNPYTLRPMIGIYMFLLAPSINQLREWDRCRLVFAELSQVQAFHDNSSKGLPLHRDIFVGDERIIYNAE